jgi:hypothetical protein
MDRRGLWRGRLAASRKLDGGLDPKARIDRQTFVNHLDGCHPRGRRALLAAAEHLGDRVGVSPEKGFDTTVAAIAHPTVKAKLPGFMLHPRPKAHPLNAAFDADMYCPKLRSHEHNPLCLPAAVLPQCA